MISPDFKDFPRHGRILGIDWGARRTGVAVTDETRNFIFTRSQIVASRGTGEIAVRVADVAKAEKVVGIVVGLPIRNDGSDSETTLSVRNFARELSEITDLPICFVEENLTSMVAQEQMGRVRQNDIKQKLDSESARVILENAVAIIQRLHL